MIEKNGFYPEITIAKGIGIVLVVVGHCIPDIFRIKQFIYLFHMPLFFFLSGYCYRVASERDWIGYCIRKIKSLYVPFVLCNCFALLFHQSFCRIGLYPQEELFQSAKQFMIYFAKILLCIKMEDIVAPLWFLPILMFVCIINILARKAISSLKWNQNVLHILVLTMYCVGFLVPRTGIFRAYVLVSLGLFSFDFGFLVHDRMIFDKLKYGMAVFFAIVLWFAAQVVDINMIQMRIGNPITYALFSSIGIYSVWVLSKLLVPLKIARLFMLAGKKSLVILEWHYYAFLAFTIIQSCLVYGRFVVKGQTFTQYYLIQSPYKLLCFLGYTMFGVFIPLMLESRIQKMNQRINREK